MDEYDAMEAAEKAEMYADEQRDLIAELMQQRDELMSALEDVMPLLLERYKHNLEKHSGTKHAALLKAEREFKNASAAIAKAKGSK